MDNPIYIAIQEHIKEMMYNDNSKQEIKEVIFSKFPDLPASAFESCYSEAFCSL
jgi:hypothetical protein